MGDLKAQRSAIRLAACLRHLKLKLEVEQGLGLPQVQGQVLKVLEFC